MRRLSATAAKAYLHSVSSIHSWYTIATEGPRQYLESSTTVDACALSLGVSLAGDLWRASLRDSKGIWELCLWPSASGCGALNGGGSLLLPWCHELSLRLWSGRLTCCWPSQW